MNLTSSSSCRTDPLSAQPVVVLWADMLPHCEYLDSFARRKLHDPALAEDLVHDVFEAVATGHASFAGRAALRTWLTAILKHQKVDLMGQRAGLDSLDDDEGAAAFALACPNPRPDDVAQQRQTVRRVLQGIADLPKNLRDAMQLRVLQDHSAEEVCKTLEITENNHFRACSWPGRA